VLAELQAVPKAGAGLDDADRAWFVQKLHDELQGLGNLTRFEASLTIVQGDQVSGDKITVGNIANSRGVAVGTGAKAPVTALWWLIPSNM